MDRVDVLIVGGGIAGLSTAWWLRRRGRSEVLVLEQAASVFWHGAPGDLRPPYGGSTAPAVQPLSGRGSPRWSTIGQS